MVSSRFYSTGADSLKSPSHIETTKTDVIPSVTRAKDRGAPLFFLRRSSVSEILRPLPKPDPFGKKKTLLYAGWKIPWHRYTCKNQWGVFSNDFGLWSPVIQKPFQAKTATSVVACDPYRLFLRAALHAALGMWIVLVSVLQETTAAVGI